MRARKGEGPERRLDSAGAGRDVRSLGNASSPTGPTSKSQKFSLVSVTSGRDCIGHIVCRGRAGFEAFDRDDVSLGIYPDMPSAANAITDAADSGEVGP